MLIDELRDRYRTSLTKTCALFGMSRSLYRYRYRSAARDSSALLMRIKEITATRVHDGDRCVHVVLRGNAGETITRVYRRYRAEGLLLSLIPQGITRIDIKGGVGAFFSAPFLRLIVCSSHVEAVVGPHIGGNPGVDHWLKAGSLKSR